MEPVNNKEKATMSTKTGDAKVAGSKDLLTVQVPIGKAREKVPDKKYQIINRSHRKNADVFHERSLIFFLMNQT